MLSSMKHGSELIKLARTYRVPLSATDTAIFDFLSSLNTPKSLAVWLLYFHGEHQQLVDIDINPSDYIDFQDFQNSYSAWAFLSKSSFLKIDVSKKDQAFKKFFQYEELCKETNNRFRRLDLDPKYHGSSVWLLNSTIQKISSILGDYEAEELIEEANWGPGVTTLLKGSHVSAINKFHSENGITRDLYSLVGDIFPVAYPRWSEHLTLTFGEQCFNFQVGNSIVTVPKNSKTDRVIAVEPGLNLWFQKGIGSMIRKRLLRRGVDLRDQTINQSLAREASVNGLLATVDFSSASDSISLEVVRALIPARWLSLMELCRSPLGVHDNKIVRWEKFSSMGNGFTFELESLIFYAAALAVREYEADLLRLTPSDLGPVSVYGDDVIISTHCYDLFVKFSDFLGFRVNKEKSFSSGYFRESCGAHWFNGSDCKPIFLKERLHNVQAIYKLANRIRDLAHRRNNYCGCDHIFRNAWRHLYSRVPKPLRFGISRELGDVGFIVNFDEATPSVAKYGFEGSLTFALLEVGLTDQMESIAVLMARLKAGSPDPRQVILGRGKPADQEYGNNYTLRGRTKLRISRILVPRWYNLGQWT